MSLKDNFNQALRELLKKDDFSGGEPPENRTKSELDRYLDPVSDAESKAKTPSSVFGGDETDNLRNPSSLTFNDRTAEPSRDEAAVSAEEQLRNSKDAYDIYANEQKKSAEATKNAGYGQTAGYSAAAADFTVKPDSGYSSSFTREQAAQPIPPSYGSGREETRRTSDFASANPFNGQNAGAVPPPNSPIYFGGTPPTSGGGSGSGGNRYEAEETTVISHNTIIDGNIRSFANINIDGTVKGDVRLTKNIAVSGKVVGDIECNNAVMTGSQMQGNIASKGQVQMDRDSIQLGDITANYLDLNGKIKGNIEVGGKAEFKTDAVILGNITASTITVLDGATIQGYVNTTFLQENSSSIFPDAISVTD